MHFKQVNLFEFTNALLTFFLVEFMIGRLPFQLIAQGALVKLFWLQLPGLSSSVLPSEVGLPWLSFKLVTKAHVRCHVVQSFTQAVRE